MNKNETIADIVAEMRIGIKDCDGEYIQEFDDYADRIEAAYGRLAIPTAEQWTEFARQGSELKKLREYDAKLEADFAALMKDRNSLAEKNRECCDENERLREALEPILNINLEEVSNSFYAGLRDNDEDYNKLSIAIANAQSKMATKEANNDRSGTDC